MIIAPNGPPKADQRSTSRTTCNGRLVLLLWLVLFIAVALAVAAAVFAAVAVVALAIAAASALRLLSAAAFAGCNSLGALFWLSLRLLRFVFLP